MRKRVSKYIRDIIARLEVDDTPEEGVGSNAKPVDQSEFKPKYVRKKDDITEHENKPTARPKIKPSRSKPGLNKFDNKDIRKEYMQEYRAEGRDLETGNRYIKKNKPRS